MVPFWLILILTIALFVFILYQGFNYLLKQRLSSWAKQVMMSDLRAIRAQMNPHFIFNSLNSINRYILKNEPEIASDYLGRFARLMRLVLDHSNHERIPLSAELETMQLYIELEQLRFEHAFKYELNVDSTIDTLKVLVQPLIFQPFLENAIWHGLMHKENGEKNLQLTINDNKGQIVCEIRDNGVGRGVKKEPEENNTKRKSYGINLVRDRLKSLDRDSEVSILDLIDEHKKPTGTLAILKFKKTEEYSI